MYSVAMWRWKTETLYSAAYMEVYIQSTTRISTPFGIKPGENCKKKTDGRWPLDFGVSPSVVAGLASLADLLFFLTKTSVVSLCLLKAVQIPDSLLLFSLFHVSRSPLVLLHSLSGCNGGGGISVTINNIFGMFLKLLAVLLILLFKPAMTMMNIVQ